MEHDHRWLAYTQHRLGKRHLRWVERRGLAIVPLPLVIFPQNHDHLLRSLRRLDGRDRPAAGTRDRWRGNVRACGLGRWATPEMERAGD